MLIQYEPAELCNVDSHEAIDKFTSINQIEHLSCFHLISQFHKIVFLKPNEFMQNSLHVSVLIGFFKHTFGISLIIDGVSSIAASIGAALSQINPASPHLI
jgi:hypothetical protein